MLNSKRILVIAILLTYFLLINVATSFAEAIAVIVNKSNSVNELTFNDLKRIFRMDRLYWNGDKIYLLLREDGSREKKVLLNKVYRMTSKGLKKFWMSKMFKGEIDSYPKLVISSATMKVYISNAHNGIGIIIASEVDDTVKVLKIDGKLPEEPGYMLVE
ncbi:MAG: hypothetical protein ACE5IH_06905 [Thermodesulfobacteriota bacterium]